MPTLITINLELGRPTIDQASLRLDRELYLARQAGAALVKIIHGYGSSGVGGVLRYAVFNLLNRKKENGEIRAFVAGEDWRISDVTTWDILKKHPELKQDRDLGKANKGISIVLL
jgi:DNA-nicking Smr family endonuclease